LQNPFFQAEIAANTSDDARGISLISKPANFCYDNGDLSKEGMT